MSKYQMIIFKRADLAEVTKVGFIAVRVGEVSCEGWVQKDRLQMLTMPYTAV